MKKNIDNTFIDLLLYFTSFVFGFFRSINLLFSVNKKDLKKNLFFDFFDFIFKIWPRYFWDKPSLYKIFSFPGTLLDYLFKNTK